MSRTEPAPIRRRAIPRRWRLACAVLGIGLLALGAAHVVAGDRFPAFVSETGGGAFRAGTGPVKPYDPFNF